MTPPRCHCGAVATGQVVEGHLHPYCAWEAEKERAERYLDVLSWISRHGVKSDCKGTHSREVIRRVDAALAADGRRWEVRGV